ncbi:2-hydroxyglutaryl-CoA dehydratase [Alteromonas macleodii]|uniref:2-hydroxyglutaryl-CoA dehydratase n=1 Tax=Alteromonas macleodii TaxID=28108 RepID=UPI00068BE8B8|nr:2-hydroxyglutaryl-CoA dehydratase [Alteromonas macleodii]
MEKSSIAIKVLPSEATFAHYKEKNFNDFQVVERGRTTLLMSGLTGVQDELISAVFRGKGHRIVTLDIPSLESFNIGKEFGNRGQCNPTYFTVGNLVKFLTYLRDDKGISVEQIISDYVFVTAGSCGPCRFGSYITEYRKALRDSGFEGFRVMVVSQTSGAFQQIGRGGGLKSNLSLYSNIIKAIIIGDIVNILGYRIRPYEVEKGSTDDTLKVIREKIKDAFEKSLAVSPVLDECRDLLSKIAVDRSIVKPKVSVIGEFWAMTTEGDGNYHLQRFLESEGAEVDIQPVTAWIQYLFWQKKYDTRQRAFLNRSDSGNKGLKGKSTTVSYFSALMSEKILKAFFNKYAKKLGLVNYSLPNMQKIANVSHQYYDNDIRGGEGHMEVGKAILNAKYNKSTMTLSVKPFGCMPSSGVSDGVQTVISKHFPDSLFLPIETTGDGKVGVQSRVQMMLFKAKERAKEEVESLSKRPRSEKIKDPLFWPRSQKYTTTAATILEASK